MYLAEHIVFTRTWQSIQYTHVPCSTYSIHTYLAEPTTITHTWQRTQYSFSSSMATYNLVQRWRHKYLKNLDILVLLCITASYNYSLLFSTSPVRGSWRPAHVGWYSRMQTPIYDMAGLGMDGRPLDHPGGRGTSVPGGSGQMMPGRRGKWQLKTWPS